MPLSLYQIRRPGVSRPVRKVCLGFLKVAISAQKEVTVIRTVRTSPRYEEAVPSGDPSFLAAAHEYQSLQARLHATSCPSEDRRSRADIVVR